MTTALQITLILVLLSVAAGLMRHLYQLGRTAKCLDAFLNSAQKELSGIALDIHAARLRVDQLADALQPSLEGLSSIAGVAERAGRAVEKWQTNFHGGFESTSRNIGNLLGLAGPVLTFFRNHLNHQAEKR